MPFPSDLEIARKAELKPLTDIAKESGIPEKSLELYGEGAAKIKLDACLLYTSPSPRDT